MKKENHFVFYIYFLLLLVGSYFLRNLISFTENNINLLTQFILLGIFYIGYKNLLPISKIASGLSFLGFLTVGWEIVNFIPIIGLGISIYMQYNFKINLGLDWSFFILKPLAVLLFFWYNKTNFLLYFNALTAKESFIYPDNQNLESIEEVKENNSSELLALNAKSEIIVPSLNNEQKIIIKENNSTDLTEKISIPAINFADIEDKKENELFLFNNNDATLKPIKAKFYFNELTQILTIAFKKNEKYPFVSYISISNYQYDYFFLNHKKNINPHVSKVDIQNDELIINTKNYSLLFNYDDLPAKIKEIIYHIRTDEIRTYGNSNHISPF